MSALLILEPYPLFIPLRNRGLPGKIAEDCSVSNKWWKEIWNGRRKIFISRKREKIRGDNKGGGGEGEGEGEGKRKDARATGHGNKFDNNKEKHFTWSRNRFAEFVAGQDLLERDDTLCFSLASCPWQRWFFYSNSQERILVESPKSAPGLLSEIYPTVNRDFHSRIVSPFELLFDELKLFPLTSKTMCPMQDSKKKERKESRSKILRANESRLTKYRSSLLAPSFRLILATRRTF